MGGFSGFVKGLSSVVQPALEKRVADKRAKEDEERQAYLKILQTPGLPQGVVDDAEKRLKNLGFDKESIGVVQKVRGLIQRVHQAHQGAGAQPQKPPNQLQPPAQSGSSQQTQAKSTATPQAGAPAPQPTAQAGAQPNEQASPVQANASPFGKLQPPARPQQQPRMSLAESVQAAANAGQANSPEAVKERQSTEDRKRREAAADDPKMFPKGITGEERAEWIEKGTFPKQQRPTTLEDKKSALHQSYLDLGFSEAEATKKTAEALEHIVTADNKKHNLEKSWIKGPDGMLVKVWDDPQNPGHRVYADSGEEVPKEIPSVDPTQVEGKERELYWGEFGNFYRAQKGLGKTDEEAREIAGKMINEKFGIMMAKSEQDMAIKRELSGVGGGADMSATETPAQNKPPVAAAPTADSATPKSATPKSSAPKSATPKSTPSTPGKLTPPGQLPALTPQDEGFVNMYLGSLFGTFPQGRGGAAGSVGVKRGMEIMARITGMSPVDFQTQQAINKDRIKAIGDTYQRYNAVNRIGNLINGFGENVEELGRKAIATGSPLLNKAWNTISVNTVGNPELRQYLLSLNALQRQYGVLTSGGGLSRAMLPVAVKENVDHLLSPSATLAEAIASVDQLKKETEIEKAGFQQSIKDTAGEIKQSLTGSGGTDTSKPKVKVWNDKTQSFDEK